MTFVRGIWADMKQKRLWPVALALVLALIAIPVVLAKPAPAPPKSPQPLASAGPAPLVASPALIRSNSDNGPVAGRFKDPFRQLHVPKQASASSTASKSTGATSSGGSSTPAGSGGSSGGSNGGSTKPSNDVKVTKLKVRFGLAGSTRSEREITPGTPLPAVSKPLIVFLDFGGSNDSAGFLISSDVVKTEGDGTCKPSKAVCSDLTLKPGDTRFFDLQNGEQYQLDVVEVVNG